MIANSGYIKLFRKLLDWEWIDCPEMVGLWINLLIRASWEDCQWHGIDIRRGQLVTTVRELAKLSGLSLQQTRTCLERLKSTHEITQQSTHQYTIVTICKYDIYQGEQTDINTPSNTAKNTRATHEQHTSNTPSASIPISSPSESKHIEECNKKETLPKGSAKKETISDPEFEKFMKWMSVYAPTIYGIDSACRPVHKFTPERFRELRDKYGSKALAKTIINMENWKPFARKNKTAYLSTVNWLERDYGDKRGQGSSKDNSLFKNQQQYTATID